MFKSKKEYFKLLKECLNALPCNIKEKIEVYETKNSLFWVVEYFVPITGEKKFNTYIFLYTNAPLAYAIGVDEFNWDKYLAYKLNISWEALKMRKQFPLELYNTSYWKILKKEEIRELLNIILDSPLPKKIAIISEQLL